MSEKVKKGIVLALAIMTTFAFTPFLFTSPEPQTQQQPEQQQQSQQPEQLATSSLVATSTPDS